LTQIKTLPSLLDGKVLICINNRDYQAAREGAYFEEAIAEGLQANAPRARVVKAFNTIAMEAFDIAPERLREAGAQTFIAGDDAEAKAVVAGLAGELGLSAVDLGPVRLARAVEALADVIRLVMIDGRRGFRAHLHVSDLPEPSLGQVGPRQPSAYG